MECLCGSTLLKAHEGIGICAWCIKEIDDRSEFIKSMPIPSYSGVDDYEYEEEDNLPKAEDYLN